MSRAAGAPYQTRLLLLPAFLLSAVREIPIGLEDIRAGYRLTEFFLKRDVFEPRGLGMPDARRAYLASLGMRPP